jgi:hypothetical protein
MGHCPFCGRITAVTSGEHGIGVFHESPTCPEYDATIQGASRRETALLDTKTGHVVAAPQGEPS